MWGQRPNRRRAVVTVMIGLALSAWSGLALEEAYASQARFAAIVTRGGVAETLDVVAAETLEGEDSLVDEFDLVGDGWRLQGSFFGQVEPADEIVPRGPIIFTGIVGLASGFINSSSMTMDVEFIVCLNLTTLPTPIQVGSSALYGGSMAGAVLDGTGDAAATLANDSSMNPIYELRTDSAACPDPTGTVATIETLYDDPASFDVVATPFGGVNVSEASFGTPIPTAVGPQTNTTFEMVIRYSVTPGDFVGITSNGVMAVGGMTDEPPQATSADRSTAGSAQFGDAPELSLVARGATAPPALGSIGFAIGVRNTPGPPAGPDEHDFEATLPLPLPIPFPSKNGGIILGSVTATTQTASACTVDTVPDRPYYAAKIDDATEFTLYDHESFHIVAEGYRSTLIPPMTFGTPIPNADGPAANTDLALNLHFELTDRCLVSLLALYVAEICPPSSLDIDDNGVVGALTDGLLILRRLFGFSGATLVNGALGAGANRTDPDEIAAYIACQAATILAMIDVDGNGVFDALTDGLLLLRYIFGFRDATLIAGAVAGDCTRCTAPEIEAFIAQFIP